MTTEKSILPNFLIIGAPRCSTTWLTKMLKQHPEIFMPAKKELHYFDNFYSDNTADYARFFADSTTQKAIGEASPSYLHRAEKVAPRIQKHLKNIQFIVILRDPVERLYSRYYNNISGYSNQRSLSFEDKIRQKPEFIEEGFYAQHLNRYFQYFPQENFLILKFEDIKSQPQQLLKKVFSFLQVTDTFVPIGLERKINSAQSKAVVGKLALVKYMTRILDKLKLYEIGEKLDSWNRNDFPPMNPLTEKMLIDLYTPHDLELTNMLGNEFSFLEARKDMV